MRMDAGLDQAGRGGGSKRQSQRDLVIGWTKFVCVCVCVCV